MNRIHQHITYPPQPVKEPDPPKITIFWQADKIALINKHYTTMGKVELTKLIGRPWAQIQSKAVKMGLRRRAQARVEYA